MELSWRHRKNFWPTIASFWFLSIAALVGQGTLRPTVLVTGTGQPLVTESRTIQTLSNAGEMRLSVHLGFSTEETSQPGIFADSFSLTLQPANSSLAPILYFTMDAGGVVWAPPSPGTFPIDPDSILRTPVSFPTLNPELPNQLSFQFDAPIPNEYVGQALSLHFDLFDNGNAARSLGWFSEPAIVPEPSEVALLFLASLICWGARRLQR
jgi:hypothetical protein